MWSFPLQYLVGQFYSDKVYREFVDWERKSKLGHGAQASCFSVCDRRTKCLLVVKEVCERVCVCVCVFVCVRAYVHVRARVSVYVCTSVCVIALP